MRKRPITPIPQDVPSRDEGWLDLDRIAVVEVTSEEKEYPVEAALGEKELQGWRASDSGAQTIRLIFDEPQRLARIALVFEETDTERTQAFVLRWSPDSGRSFREIVRQQRNFNLPNSMRESGEYQVGLSDVTQSRIVSRLAQESAGVLTRTGLARWSLGVPFEFNVGSDLLDDDSTIPTSLGITSHVLTDLECFRHSGHPDP